MRWYSNIVIIIIIIIILQWIMSISIQQVGTKFYIIRPKGEWCLNVLNSSIHLWTRQMLTNELASPVI